MKYQPKTKPFPHQAKATLEAVRHRNYGIFFEPRLGKSKAALDYCGIWALKREPEWTKVLILGPRISLDVWEAEIDEHYPWRASVETFDEHWLNANYRDLRRNMLIRHTAFFLASREETFVKRKGERPKQVILEKWDPDIIILDESHEYARPGGRGAQDAWRLIRRLRKRRGETGMPYVLLLTGTPTTSKGWLALFAQFRIMDDSIFGTNAGDFKEEYVRFHRKYHWKIIGYQNEEKLKKKIRAHSISMSAEEAGMANEQFLQTLKVDLPPRAKKMYLELASEFLTEWEGGMISAANAGVKRLRLLQLTGGFTTEGQKIHSAKLEKLRAYLQLLVEQEESVVVYARFTPEVAAIYPLLDSVGYRAYRVDGTVEKADRRSAIASLARRPSTPTAIVFQYQAGSRAISLVGAAETVYYSTPDGWVDYFQTKSRVLGPHQKRPVRYTHLVCPGTVDVGTIRGLEVKEDWHGQMMASPKRYLFGLY